MKRLICFLLALGMLMALLSGCSREIDNSGYVATGDAILMEGEEPTEAEEEEDAQNLVLAYYPGRSLNPVFGSDYTNRVLMSLMYQGLFAVDNDKNVTPILCASYKVSTNNRNWTFYLEEGATFSDGTKVTAADVVATYQRAMENDYYKYRFYKHLLDVEATEDGGILFQTDTDFQNLPLLLDVPIVKASDVDKTAPGEIPIGSGPYVFVETSSGAVLQRDPNWWCGALKIPARDQTIDLVAVSSTAEVRDAFQFNGENSVSVVCTNPMSDSFAEYRCDYELWEIESGYMLYIGCNILYSEHFDDGTLRTFLTYGIDRETLAESAYNGLVDAVTLPCSPSVSYYNKSLASKYAYDPMKFIDRLSSYRIPQKDGKDKEMRLLVNSDDSARTRIAREIASTLTDLGLPCTTLEASGTTFKNIIVAGSYDIYLGMTRLSPDMDLTEFFRPYGEMGWGGLSNEILYNMCLKALEDTGNFYNFYQKLAEDGRIIPLMFGYYNVYAHRGLLPDLNPSRDNVFYYSMGKSMEDIYIEETGEE
ncbi:MAG: ABC transporter substrate-binding protein [Eubacteriales bacterium]|nr:ABC transporter substrate-binding protein [Eubacteriales bacterium]